MANEYAEVQDIVNAHLSDVATVEVSKQAKDHNIEIIAGHASLVEKSNKTLTIIVPEAMNKLQAAFNLVKQFKEEETTRMYNRAYSHFFINDFIVTLQKLIPQYFGMLHVSKIRTDGYPAHTDYIQIPVGYDIAGNTRYEKGYIGSIVAPVWENAIIDIAPGNIIIKAKMKFEEEVNEFLADVEESIRKNSIVKGQAVTVNQHQSGGLIASPIKAKVNNTIILSDKVERVINNLIIPSLRDKSKTSLLFTGDFGTGKTETAIKVGMEARKRYERTFFYLSNAEMFTPLIPYLKNYQGALVFCEDVDQIASGERDSNMNTLLNQLDGNELKNIDCTFIFTTNNHDKIHPAMRRPGRIDQIVHFDYCTIESIAKIFEVYARGTGWEGVDDIDYMEAAKACPERLQGAVVAEIARRAVKYSENLYNKVITTDRFLDAIASMDDQIRFMRQDQKIDHSVENLLAHTLFKTMKKAFPKLDTAAILDGENPFEESKYAGLQS